MRRGQQFHLIIVDEFVIIIYEIGPKNKTTKKI